MRMDEIAGSPGTDPEQTSPAGISTQTYAPVHRVFIGNDGLRAGWRLVLYLVGFFALLYVLILANRLLLAKRAPGPPPIWFFLLGECESFAAAVISALVLGRIEKRPFGIYGLPGKGAFGKRFWMGVVWGFCAISALLLVMRGVGAFYYGGFSL